jgi:D-serine deaminase-like pyridoxal phosphate-dependent protein
MALLSPHGQGVAGGDEGEVIPNPVCLAVKLTDEPLATRDGHVVDRWPVATRVVIG